MSGPEDARVLGPLAPLKAGFIEELDRLGYSRLTATQHVHLLHHLSQHVASEGVEGKITPDVFARLAAARREAGYTHQRTERALAPLANYLRVLGVATPLPAPAPPRNFAEELLERYRGYLVSERSLAESTVYRCVRTARRFFEARGCQSARDIGRLSAADV